MTNRSTFLRQQRGGRDIPIGDADSDELDDEEDRDYSHQGDSDASLEENG
jgi:hypothetical protein